MSTYIYRVYNIEWFKKHVRLNASLPAEVNLALSSYLVLGEGIRDADWIREIKDQLQRKTGVRPKRFCFGPQESQGGRKL